MADGTLGFKSFPGATKTVFDRTHLAFAAGGTNGAPFCRSADETALAGHALSIEISSGSTSHIVRCTKPSTDGLRVGCAGAAGTTEQQQQSQCSPHGSHGVTSTTPGTNGGIGRPSYYTQRRVSKRVTLYSHCILQRFAQSVSQDKTIQRRCTFLLFGRFPSRLKSNKKHL